MRPRSITSVYQSAARAWLTLAGLSFLLPVGARLGIWLPLHLTLAGAASVAIFGAVQLFSTTMTATPDPPTSVVWAEFGLVNGAVAAIAIGRPADLPWLVAMGGVAFVSAACLLVWVLRTAWMKALNKHHPLPLQMYGFAIACVIVGGALGAMMGSGRISSGTAYLDVRHAHMTLNVLGWIGVTICATLVTLLPTILRVRMPVWHGRGTGVLLASGVILLATGLAFGLTPVAATGGLAWLAGVVGVLWMVAKVIKTPRRYPPPVAARHILAAIAWFALGSVALAISVGRGAAGFDDFRADFLVLFVLGWIVQTLLGAWLYLLPMQRPAHPDQRRATLRALEFGGWIELFALNAGVALLAARGAGWVPAAVGEAGVILASAGVSIALVKAWCFPWLGGLLTGSPPRRRHFGWLPHPPEES